MASCSPSKPHSAMARLKPSRRSRARSSLLPEQEARCVTARLNLVKRDVDADPAPAGSGMFRRQECAPATGHVGYIAELPHSAIDAAAKLSETMDGLLMGLRPRFSVILIESRSIRLAPIAFGQVCNQSNERGRELTALA